jgi:ankyrin repeat protein
MGAARAGSMPVVEALLAAKANVQAQDAAGSTALTYAAVSLQEPIVRRLQKAGLRKGADAGVLYAAGACGTDMVKLLLAGGATLKATQDGTTAIMRAAESGCTDTVRFLLANGADANATNTDGTTPLIAAAGAGSIEIVELLLKAGADLEVRNKAGETPWMLASGRGHLEIVGASRVLPQSSPVSDSGPVLHPGSPD